MKSFPKGTQGEEPFFWGYRAAKKVSVCLGPDSGRVARKGDFLIFFQSFILSSNPFLAGLPNRFNYYMIDL
jgi:hypothetical protein